MTRTSSNKPPSLLRFSTLQSAPSSPAIPSEISRWLTALVAALVILASSSLQAQTYLIDFGDASVTTHGAAPENDPNNYWNNVNNVGVAIGTTPNAVLSNLVSSLNSTSSISLVSSAVSTPTMDPARKTPAFIPKMPRAILFTAILKLLPPELISFPASN